ncbi:MAG: RseA family anti-sigma factor [Gammaproteobacteria bacterium]|nr:RseA family anti-sigma factor [Gammaproteobacteria bacterium]
MNEALKMQISAFVDGELPDNESELLLRRLCQDAEMRRQFAGYLRIGRLIRRDRDVPGMDALRGRIAAALGDESLPIHEKSADVGSGFISPTTGIAVAATVAVVALFGLSRMSVPDDEGLFDAVAIDMAPSYTEPSVEDVLMNSPSERQLDYLRRHSDSSPDFGASDIIYRMADFQVTEGLVVIEPDGHLAGTGEEDTAEEEGGAASPSGTSQGQ